MYVCIDRERERETAPDIKGLQGRQLLERRRQGRRALGTDAIIAANPGHC